MRFLIIFFISCIYIASLTADASAYTRQPVMQAPVGGGIVVTSPFGPRDHPVSGEPQRIHKGVDIGTDYGDPIYAAADGVVTNVLYEEGGYGHYLIIDHGNGVFSLYAHNERNLVYEGQYVSKGQVIAISGSSGRSTGPHVHFEVMEGSIQNEVFPGFYCSALAGAISDGDSYGGEPMDEDYGAFNFDAQYDYGKPVREVLQAMTQACSDGLKAAKEPVSWLLIALMVIDLALSTGEQILDENIRPQRFAKFALHKVLYFGFILYMLGNWGSIMGNAVRGLFTSFGAYGVGRSFEDAEAMLTDPTAILSKGMYIISPIFDQMDNMAGLKMLVIPGALCTYVFSLILVVVLFILFTIIVFQIMKAHLHFYFTVLFSFCSWFFSGWKHTTQYASNGINAVFASAVNLMFYAFFSLLLETCLMNVSCDALYATAEPSGVTITYNELSPETSLEEFMARIRAVESSNNYYVWDDIHESFGAYQINVQVGNWNNWCSRYIADGGVLDTSPLLASAEEPPSAYPWTAANQDKIAAYIMTGYYNRYGNWHDVAVAWNGGEGAVGKNWPSTEGYYAKVCGAKGPSFELLVPAINMLVLIEILCLVLMFMVMGDRIHTAIINAVGQMGFRLRTM